MCLRDGLPAHGAPPGALPAGVPGGEAPRPAAHPGHCQEDPPELQENPPGQLDGAQGRLHRGPAHRAHQPTRVPQVLSQPAQTDLSLLSNVVSVLDHFIFSYYA